MSILNFNNTGILCDTEGKVLQSHGGYIIRYDDFFYLYGEDRREGNKVSCYRSKDLTNWENMGVALSVESEYQSLPLYRYKDSSLYKDAPVGETKHLQNSYGVTIERPKVLYNEKTNKFVMWMHWENGYDYTNARAAIASSDTPEGPFVYHGSFRPVGNMSRDCTLYKDDDGTAYFLSDARDNADMNLYRLTDDYLAVDEFVKALFPNQFREAPAIVKHDGLYYMISSECTGWEPNQGRFTCSDSITGKWSTHKDIGTPTTFDTQATFIIKVEGSERTTYLYVGDRWDPCSYFDSRYIILPLAFGEDGNAQLEWVDALSVDLETGLITKVPAEEPSEYRFKSKYTGLYVQPMDEEPEDCEYHSRRLTYSSPYLKWELRKTDDGVMIKNAETYKYMTVMGDMVVQRDRGIGDQVFTINQLYDGCCNILSSDGRALTMSGTDENARLVLREFKNDYDMGWGLDDQAFILTKVYGY